MINVWFTVGFAKIVIILAKREIDLQKIFFKEILYIQQFIS